jgi:hypothetical protein
VAGHPDAVVPAGGDDGRHAGAMAVEILRFGVVLDEVESRRQRAGEIRDGRHTCVDDRDHDRGITGRRLPHARQPDLLQRPLLPPDRIVRAHGRGHGCARGCEPNYDAHGPLPHWRRSVGPDGVERKAIRRGLPGDAR